MASFLTESSAQALSPNRLILLWGQVPNGVLLSDSLALPIMSPMGHLVHPECSLSCLWLFALGPEAPSKRRGPSGLCRTRRPIFDNQSLPRPCRSQKEAPFPILGIREATESQPYLVRP